MKFVQQLTHPQALFRRELEVERMKKLHYFQKWVNSWYWRTKKQKEIDCIEESDGQLMAYEFKWNHSAKYKIPKLFLET